MKNFHDSDTVNVQFVWTAAREREGGQQAEPSSLLNLKGTFFFFFFTKVAAGSKLVVSPQWLLISTIRKQGYRALPYLFAI